jgi:AcrR family transcriptional regulator
MMMTHREIRKEDTRKKLIEAALIQFGRNGIMATRMSDIAAAAGVAHGTVFAHFDTQAALVEAVISEFGAQLAARTHELAAHSAGLREVLEAHLAGIKENEAFYSRLVIEARLLPAASRDTFISIQSAVSFHISQAAQREMAAGTIRSMPIPLLFNTWIGLIHYYLANADLFAPEGSVVERYGPLLVDTFIQLVSSAG